MKWGEHITIDLAKTKGVIKENYEDFQNISKLKKKKEYSPKQMTQNKQTKIP